MKLSQQIQSIIDEVKQQKNHLHRNKIMSHLEDAKAHAIAQEVSVPPSLAETAPTAFSTTGNAPNTIGCTCPPGVVDRDCLFHP